MSTASRTCSFGVSKNSTDFVDTALGRPLGRVKQLGEAPSTTCRSSTLSIDAIILVSGGLGAWTSVQLGMSSSSEGWLNMQSGAGGRAAAGEGAS